MNKHLEIAIVNTMPFPSGAASVNRILSYSRGLVELGNNVIVYSTYFGKDLEIHSINNIKYRALRRKTNSYIRNKLSLFESLFRIIALLLSSNNKTQVIILVSNSLLLIYPLYFICRIQKIIFIQEKSEFPFVLYKKSNLGKLYSSFYVNTTYKLFDGLIIMTYKLEEYFKNKIKENSKTIVIPMTVEPNRFNIESKNNLGEYIAYCGDIGGNKDGVQNLITSFSYLADDFPTLRLLLIGDSKNPNELVNLKIHVQKIKCKNVIFYGMVPRDEIPPLLCNAKVLALARPSSLQSTGGFPTKLGEYLSTGIPTIVTKVGDIPLYLKDNENAFLVNPDDNKAFAAKIRFVLNNYDKALSVAKNGKRLVYDTFNYKVQAERIEKYLLELIT
ncbi:MAG: glycosyltransferase family 4 protein [Bacteroidia bacterium]|jgi:glycosyltransferase involved in cell wall biosynthesis|nr:glycosyltransferase family 4 protein [Bacteroidia bacterium]